MIIRHTRQTNTPLVRMELYPTLRHIVMATLIEETNLYPMLRHTNSSSRYSNRALTNT